MEKTAEVGTEPQGIRCLKGRKNRASRNSVPERKEEQSLKEFGV